MRMELMGYKYTIVYRSGVQNRVADALTRLDFEEEVNLDQFLERYDKELELKIIRAMTRSGTDTVGKPQIMTNPKPFVNCQPSLAKEDDEYDRIYSLVSETNRELIEKLAGDSEIDQNMGMVRLTDQHQLYPIRTYNIENDLKTATEEIFKQYMDEPEILSIGINTDLRAKHLFILKWLLEQRLQQINIHITIHTNQVISLTDPR